MTDACLSRDLADGIATLTLNRPDKSNAFDQDMWRALREALQWADDTPEVRVVLLTGAGVAGKVKLPAGQTVLQNAGGPIAHFGDKGQGFGLHV